MIKVSGFAFLFTITTSIAGCTTPAPFPDQSLNTTGIVRTFAVAPAKVPCVGVAPMECLQIRRLPNQNWELFYDTITGFDFEPGTCYVIEVFETKVYPVPADASSVSYRLLRIKSKH